MKLAFIGMGNMASALVRGFVGTREIAPHHIKAYAPNKEKLAANAKALGFVPAASLHEAVEGVDIVFMACKPHQVPGVVKELGDALVGKALVSVALGFDHAAYDAILPRGVRVQFIMPNTPAAVGEGVFLFEETTTLAKGELEFLKSIFSALGTVIVLPSSQMGIGGAIAGCGPAFVDMMIDAFADAGVRYGLSRENALKMTAQMILGSAKLQRETGKHPGVLKDEVCSPGGSTIKGVAALEKAGFRDNCISAIDAIMHKK